MDEEVISKVRNEQAENLLRLAEAMGEMDLYEDIDMDALYQRMERDGHFEFQKAWREFFGPDA